MGSSRSGSPPARRREDCRACVPGLGAAGRVGSLFFTGRWGRVRRRGAGWPSGRFCLTGMSGTMSVTWRRWVRLGLAAVLVSGMVGAGSLPEAQAQAAEPVVSVGSATVMETLARGDWVPVVVPVTLDRPAAGPVTVTYHTADGSARAGQPDRDYEPVAGTRTIPAGSLGGTIWVYVLGDRLREVDESFTVALDSASGATLGTVSGTVVIRERRVPGLVVSDARVVEPDDSSAALVVLTIALSERQPGAVSVNWSTQELAPTPPGGAYEGAEYLAGSGTAVIPAGELATRVQLWARGDTAPEGPEAFRVVLDNASTSAPVADGTGIVTITDNDAPALTATTRASVATDGSQSVSGGPSALSRPAVSADGRFVAFESTAGDLVPGDT